MATTAIEWRETGDGQRAILKLWCDYTDGERIRGTAAQQLMYLDAYHSGAWRVRFQGQLVDGQAEDLRAAKVAAVKAVPAFARTLVLSPLAKPYHVVAYGPASGGITRRI